MRKVYLVTHGEWSDYMVLCAFERKGHAEAYIAALVAADDERERGDSFRRYGRPPYDQPKVEEYDLWDVVPIVGLSDAWQMRGEEELSRP